MMRTIHSDPKAKDGARAGVKAVLLFGVALGTAFGACAIDDSNPPLGNEAPNRGEPRHRRQRRHRRRSPLRMPVRIDALESHVSGLHRYELHGRRRRLRHGSQWGLRASAGDRRVWGMHGRDLHQQRAVECALRGRRHLRVPQLCLFLQHADGHLPVKRLRFVTVLASGAILGAGLFAACLDGPNDPLPNEAPNRIPIFLGGGDGGGSAGGGGPADNCECVAAFVSDPDCAGCLVSQCADLLNACGSDGGAGPGSGGGDAGTSSTSCSAVVACVKASNGDADTAIACIGGDAPANGQVAYQAFLTCACAVCGSKCSDPGVTCAGGSGGGSTTSTLSTTGP
jgi:hypothetical protein